jgi:hypothetical protein
MPISMMKSAALVTFAALTALASDRASAADATFRLFPDKPFAACFEQAGQMARATAKVTRGKLNDTLVLNLSGFKPDLDFDLFTVEKSNQLANGSPDPSFTSFGLAWYQSDVHVGADGTGSVTIRTILLDQIFGFDPLVSLPPTNTVPCRVLVQSATRCKAVRI